MAIEDRLYVVAREAVNEQFETYWELADKIHASGAAEFSYNRLDQKHVMQPNSIVPYVSLAHFIGIIRKNDDETYQCILDEEPNFEGLTEIITQKSIEKLDASGFTRTQYLRTARRMVRAETIMLPGLREIYAAMSLKLPEPHFIQLTSMGGVRRHFGFTLVTRRIMLPTEATA